MAETQPGVVLFFSNDLMFASRVKGAAERADLTFRMVPAIAKADFQKVEFVILDLATKAALAADLVVACNDNCFEGQLIAFGPHVQTAILAQARAAGIERVLTRGQFDSGLATLFQTNV